MTTKSLTGKMGLITLYILISFLMGGCIMQDSKKSDELMKNMAEYLKNTYGKEFVVEKPESKGNEGFGYKPVAIAHPKDLPGVSFQVTYYTGDKKYDDNYLGYLWSYQATQVVQKQLKELYGEELPLIYTFNINDKSLKGLNYPEVLEKYGDRALQDIFYCVFLDKPIDKKKEAQRAFEVLKSNILEKKKKMFYLTVVYINMEFKEEFVKKFEKMKKTQESNI